MLHPCKWAGSHPLFRWEDIIMQEGRNYKACYFLLPTIFIGISFLHTRISNFLIKNLILVYVSVILHNHKTLTWPTLHARFEAPFHRIGRRMSVRWSQNHRSPLTWWIHMLKLQVCLIRIRIFIKLQWCYMRNGCGKFYNVSYFYLTVNRETLQWIAATFWLSNCHSESGKETWAAASWVDSQHRIL